MKHHIVFIDSRVNDIQSLIAGLGPDTQWVMVDANQDGIAQMQAALAGLSGLDSIQVVSHGSVGTLVLGTTVLNASSLGSYETQLKAIGTSLSATGDLMLYGCNVAQGDAGVRFMDALAQATGADVAASTGLTGLGGNWILEATSGAVEAAALNPIGYSATLDVITGDIRDNVLNGTAGSDSLIGLAGNDTLDGGAGADTMTGGDGFDTYSVRDAGDVVVETNAVAATGGTDTVYSYLGSYTLTTNVENGFIEAAGAANLTGNSLANRIDGNAGNNILSGLGGNDTLYGEAGADTLIGGLGNDTFVVDDGDVVTELAGEGTDTVESYLSSYTLGANVENGRIIDPGVANLTGNGLANVLYSGDGDNVLDGSTGTDTVSYLDAISAVTASLAEPAAQATGGSGSDTFIAIENLAGSSYADRLTGSTAANTLDGGIGADTMIGGDGSDIYYVDNVGDVVTETNATAATGGTDTVYSHLANYTLGTNVENGRILATGPANLTGNGLNNFMYAGAGNNVIDGGTGTDTASYIYATSAITASLAEPAAQATGGSGSDTFTAIENLAGSSYADRLTGSTAANTLDGGVGNDTLTGGLGADRLTGGTGSDTFCFVTTGDGSDTITDFASGTDTIYIEAANFGLTAGDAVTLINGTPTTAAAVFVYNSTTGVLGFDSDGSGIAAATQLATLSNKPVGFNSADFVLGA